MHVSTSFVQDQAHPTKSARYVHVQPSQLAMVLEDHGFTLGHLKTGQARKAERAHHQTTIARYVANDSSDLIRTIGNGSSLDLLVRAPHLTGSIELRLGFFRGTCANQWNAGKLLASVRVRHSGDCLETLNRAIPQLVGQRATLVDSIERMAGRTVTPVEVAHMAQAVADMRLAGAEGVTRAHVGDLLRPRRGADVGARDLFTVANVLQENAIRFGMRYETAERNMTTRKIVETSAAAVDLTGNIWEEAAKLLQ